MKKRIFLVVVLFMLFVGVVNASSINGEYEGNPIVKIVNNGKEVSAEDVPALIYNGRTMVPIALLKKIGAKVTWDPDKYSVDVKLPTDEIQNNEAINPITEYKQYTKDVYDELKKGGSNIQKISIEINANGSINFYIGYVPHPSLSNDQLITNLAALASLSPFLSEKIDGTVIDVIVGYTTVFSVSVKKDYSDQYYNNKITKENFIKTWVIKNNSNTGVNSSISPPVTTSKEMPKLYSNDGKVFLGNLTTDKYDSDSIYNTYGDYGSKYASKSIWNEYGNYGSQYSNTSAFDDYATKPPVIILNGKIIGYITTNKYTTGAISPVVLYEWLTNNKY